MGVSDLLHYISLLGSTLTLVYILFGVERAGRLVGEVLYDPGANTSNLIANWLRGVIRVILLSWHAPTLIFAFPRRRLLGARYFIEIAILHPRALKPNERDYTPAEFEERLRHWEKNEQDRRRDIESHLRERLSEEPGLPAVLLQYLARLIGLAGDSGAKVAAIEVKSISQLDDSRAIIKRYFEALERRKSYIPREAADRFLTEAWFGSGYLAPMFLITGLLNRFSEDGGWKHVIENYRKLTDNDATYSQELRELRSFQFNCWLLWGPSVSICSCEEWHSRPTGQPMRDLIVQYGYGDENNSVDTLVKDGFSDDFRNRVHMALNKHAADQLNTPFALAAAPFMATGLFRWGPCLDEAEVPFAQALIKGGVDVKNRQPINGRIVLECKSSEIVSASASGSSRYYSAYLWTMFTLRDAAGNCFFPEKWKNLFVFFEHANIADASTYHALKEQLVAKMCATLTRILTETRLLIGSNLSDRLKIVYACAFDDPNCSDSHSALFPPDKLGRSEAGRVTFEDVRIKTLLQKAIAALPNDHVLKSNRLVLVRSSAPNEYSSCHLPAIVEQFYAQLKLRANPRSQSGTANPYNAKVI